ncbi:hypothetical protein D3C75_864960 [compost metagenome]
MVNLTMSSACATESSPSGVISRAPVSRSARVSISSGCRVLPHSSSSRRAQRKRRNDLYSSACTGYSATAARKASTMLCGKVSCSRRGEYGEGARLKPCGSSGWTTEGLSWTTLVMAGAPGQGDN